MRHGWRLFLFAAFSLVTAQGSALAQGMTLRVGHFPNITHVQALVARAIRAAGQELVRRAARPGRQDRMVRLQCRARAPWRRSSPTALDLTYVGPNPALNAYARSRGEEVRVVAGAVNGGSALVVQGDSTLTKPADFRGKRIATPQFGNTQDVAARAWLVAGRPAHHADRRRRAGAADRQSRSAVAVPEQAARRGLDRGALGLAARIGSRRQGPRRGEGRHHHRPCVASAFLARTRELVPSASWRRIAN